MKTIKVITAAVLFAGFTSLSFAGPGPQFWGQQARNAQACQAKAVTTAKVESPATVATCAACSCCSTKKS